MPLSYLALMQRACSVKYGLLNSRFHGVPQNRERIYLVAYRHFRAEGGRKIFPVTAGDGKALIQLIGGTQGKRVYDPAGVSYTLMSVGGGFAGRTGMYFIDLCKGEPRLTEHARCIKARYDSGITTAAIKNTGAFAPVADPDLVIACNQAFGVLLFQNFRRTSLYASLLCVSKMLPLPDMRKRTAATASIWHFPTARPTGAVSVKAMHRC